MYCLFKKRTRAHVLIADTNATIEPATVGMAVTEAARGDTQAAAGQVGMLTGTEVATMTATASGRATEAVGKPANDQSCLPRSPS